MDSFFNVKSAHWIAGREIPSKSASYKEKCRARLVLDTKCMIPKPGIINLKLVVVGDGAVGKTCLLIRYAEDRFPTDYVPTVCDNYKGTTNRSNHLINLSTWDTAGERFQQFATRLFLT